MRRFACKPASADGPGTEERKKERLFYNTILVSGDQWSKSCAGASPGAGEDALRRCTTVLDGDLHRLQGSIATLEATTFDKVEEELERARVAISDSDIAAFHFPAVINEVAELKRILGSHFLFLLFSTFKKGSKSGVPGTCYGVGMKAITRQIGLGMMQQMNTVCPECRGSGEIVRDRDKCANCRASKAAQEKKVLEVHIEKGMQHDQNIAFLGEADEALDTET